MEQRLYTILQSDGTRRLIEAANPAQAYRFAAKAWIAGVNAASARDVAELMRAGVKIEQANQEDTTS